MVTDTFCVLTSVIVMFIRYVEKCGTDRTLTTIKYGACALHAGSLRIQTYRQTHTQKEYIILFVFARKQWFREGASMLR